MSPRPKPKLSSVWFCAGCQRKEVALGLPKRAKCSKCLKFMDFVEALGQPRPEWTYPKPAR